MYSIYEQVNNFSHGLNIFGGKRTIKSVLSCYRGFHAFYITRVHKESQNLISMK